MDILPSMEPTVHVHLYFRVLLVFLCCCCVLFLHFVRTRYSYNLFFDLFFRSVPGMFAFDLFCAEYSIFPLSHRQRNVCRECSLFKAYKLYAAYDIQSMWIGEYAIRVESMGCMRDLFRYFQMGIHKIQIFHFRQIQQCSLLETSSLVNSISI